MTPLTQPSPSLTAAIPALASTVNPNKQLSPFATPFMPGHPKQQCWLSSPSSSRSDSELPVVRAPIQISYREVVLRGIPSELQLVHAPRDTMELVPAEDGDLTYLSGLALPPSPSQPCRFRVRFELHGTFDAATEEGWHVVRRRQPRPLKAPLLHPRREFPKALRGRCFNCLEGGHQKKVCREPTRCLRCGKPVHRSFECRCPRRRALGGYRDIGSAPGAGGFCQHAANQPRSHPGEPASSPSVAAQA